MIEPKIRGPICLNTHPPGCREETRAQIDYIRKQSRLKGPKNTLVIGSSGGYGLASRITAAFACGSATLGIAYEKEPTEKREGTSGYYNTEFFDQEAARSGLISGSLNGDAFSEEIKHQTIETLKRNFGPLDLVIYSLASPVRTDPASGITYRSVLKPFGQPYTSKSLDPLTAQVTEVTINPATEEERDSTVKVMGGEDWELWIRALQKENLLAPGVITVSYSYVGPSLTFPIYREGTIGKAKEHLEKTASSITDSLSELKGRAYVSVNKALVTKAAAAIPVVPLYIALLFKVMREKGIHEGCIEQIYRLFSEKLYAGGPAPVDSEGRIRIDDWEMREDVQAEVERLWKLADNSNIRSIADIEGYTSDFLRIHGFAVPGVDYS